MGGLNRAHRCFDLRHGDRVAEINNDQSTMENPHEAEQTRLLERIIKNVVSYKLSYRYS